ncbi:MAG TPA: ATP-binding protein [Caulobacteraceae bacterium]
MLDLLTRLTAVEDWRLVPLAGVVCALAAVGAFLGWSRASRLRAAAPDPALERLRDAIDAMPEGLAFYDLDDRLIIWNTRYVELAEGGDALRAGSAFRDILLAGIQRGVYPEARGCEEAWVEQRLALHRAGHSTHEQQLEDGRWLRVEDRRTRDGGVISVCEDITDLKRREASLRLMFESNPAPMWVVDGETQQFLAVNEAAIAHYGYTREQFLSMQLTDLYFPEEVEALRNTSGMIATYGAYRGERSWRQRKADGSELFARPYVQAFRYEDRPAFMSAQFDVTVSKRAEEAMALARDHAEAANRAKSEFLANMSHEIRTPLNGVAGLAQVLARTNLDPQQQEMVRVISSSADTLERILSDVLDLARVESGRIEIREEPFDLVQEVKATAALCELRAQEKGVAFELEIDPAAAGEVRGDCGRLKQILFNLLSNALKFTAQGHVALRLTMPGGPQGALFRFEVEDTGVGFDPAAKERLFGRFEQEDGSITRRYGGTGLGLAISRELAELMGGTLDATSVPGQGASFVLELPLERCGATAGCKPLVEGARLRVLLADDHAVNRQVVEMMLSGTGVDLQSVENGEEAVKAVAADRFDVVLMDMQMPVMDGLDALRAIRRRERETGAPRTTVFMLSANAMPEHARSSLAAGADKHLTKPIAAPELLGALAELAQVKGEEAAA